MTSCPSGPAREAGNDPDLRAAALAVVTRSGAGGMIQTVSNDPIFEFDVLRVDTARWLDIGQPGTRPGPPDLAGPALAATRDRSASMRGPQSWANTAAPV
jgi:hypothetical protein